MKEIKYKLTNESKIILKTKVYRIEALIDIKTPYGTVEAGSKGGFVESRRNLSDEGNCWVFDNAVVLNKAKVLENGQIYGNAKIYDNARVYGNAQISGKAQIFGSARIFGDARIYKSVKIYENAVVKNNACITDSAQIFGEAYVSGNSIISNESKIYDCARISDNAEVNGKSQIFNTATLEDSVKVDGNSKIFGIVSLCGTAVIPDLAVIKSDSDYMCLGPIGSRDDFLTAFRSTKKSIMVATGCFIGTIDQFKKQLSQEHGDNFYANQYLRAIELIQYSLAPKVINK